MTTIALEGMQFFANHGYYEEEQATNTYFIVDVYVQIGDKSMREVTIADDLTGTVNYEMIYEICKIEIPNRSSCTGLTIADNASSGGALNWICKEDSANNQLVIYSTNLRKGKYLSDLIDWSLSAPMNNKTLLTS